MWAMQARRQCRHQQIDLWNNQTSIQAINQSLNQWTEHVQQALSQPMLPSGGQMFFLPAPRYTSCVHQDVQHFNKLRRRAGKEAGAVPAIFRADVRELVWKRRSVALAVGSTRQLQPRSPASPQTRHVKCSQGAQALCHKSLAPAWRQRAVEGLMFAWLCIVLARCRFESR